MFHSARIKLTLWYVLIIMLVSVMFSAAIYKVLTVEVERFERTQRFRIERQLREGIIRPLPSPLPLANPELVAETEQHILLLLVIINSIIFCIVTGAAYFLAGKTLEPIKEMVDEQNRFITDASHELRTPLTSLKTAMEVHLRDEKLTLSDAKEVLKQNIEDVNTLQTLSDALLTLAHFQQPNVIQFEPILLSSIVKKSIKMVYVQAKQKHMVLQNKTNDVIISGNTYELVDLLVILLDNAIKYGSEKSVITIASKRIDGHVVINVTNTGIGISEKDIPHIFDRFYRGDVSRQKTNGGYGLGLAIAKKIAETHGGSISVENSHKKKTIFTIQLPIKQFS